MSDKERRGAFNSEQEPPGGESPNEKLHDEESPATPVPGAENPESEEIKKEVNPNTE